MMIQIVVGNGILLVTSPFRRTKFAKMFSLMSEALRLVRLTLVYVEEGCSEFVWVDGALLRTRHIEEDGIDLSRNVHLSGYQICIFNRHVGVSPKRFHMQQPPSTLYTRSLLG